MKTKHILSLFIVGLLAASSALQAQTTAVPDRISYQGYVTDLGGGAVGGTGTVNRTVIFRVWDSATASLTGNLLYSEQQTVTISAGEFSVLVGGGANVTGTPLGFSETTKGPGTVNINSVFGASTRYLGVTVDDGTAAADTEITPRHQIVTTAYTFRAKVAEGVTTGAITSAMIGAGAITGANIGSTTITNANLANTTITDAKLDVISAAGKVANSATTATTTNTFNTIVLRDGSGNFSAGTITANLNGNAANVTGTVALANGGTGSTTKNFVDLTTAQTVAGAKTFSGAFNVTNAGTISPTNGLGGLNIGTLTSDHLAMNANNLSAYGGAGGNVPGTLNLNHSGGNVILNASGNAGNLGLRTTAAPRSILELSPPAATVDGIILGKTNDTASRFVGIHGASISFAADSGFSGIEFGGPGGVSTGAEGFLAFHTHDSNVSSGERMRIDKNGKVGIGVTAPSSVLDINVQTNTADHWDVRFVGVAATGAIRMTDNGFLDITNVAGTGSNHGGLARLNNSGSWSAVSDRRLKHEIEPLGGLLEKALALKPVSYRFKTQTTKERHLGFIAQEVQELLPSFVNEGETLTLNYAGLSTVAIGAIQEQHQIVKEQQRQIAALDERVKALEARDKARDAKLAAFEKLLDAMEKPAARTVSLKTGAE